MNLLVNTRPSPYLNFNFFPTANVFNRPCARNQQNVFCLWGKNVSSRTESVICLAIKKAEKRAYHFES